MPIYEYECQKCGHEFEREQRIIEDPIKKCPACKAQKAKRLISKTSFVLKGGGWYNDLYSSAKAEKSEKEPASGDSDSKSADKSGKDGKAETKADSKSDSKSGSDGKKKSKGKKKSAA